MEQIPETFANTQETETILAPVIQAGIQALKVNYIYSLEIYNKTFAFFLNREQIVQVKFIFFQQHYQLQLHRENYQIVMIKSYLELKKKKFVKLILFVKHMIDFVFII